MNLAEQIRNESLKLSKDDFSEQERRVLACIRIGMDVGYKKLRHAWGIRDALSYGMLITSVRRALSNLKADGEIEVDGTIHYDPTDRNVSLYKISVRQYGIFGKEAV